MKHPRKPAASAPARDRSGVLYVDGTAALRAELDAWVTMLNSGGAMPRWTRTALVIAVLTRAARERGTTGDAP